MVPTSPDPVKPDSPRRFGWREAAAGSAVLLLGAFALVGCSSGSGDSASGDPSSAPECEGQTVNPPLPIPKELKSENGVLDLTLTAKIGQNCVSYTSGTAEAPGPEKWVSLKGPSYDGTITGPTLRVKPGDEILMNLVNEFPANPDEQRMGGYPHDPYTTNMHFHGLSVSPRGIGDNPFRQVEPGESAPVTVRIPKTAPTGTFWYHPHKHGATSFQFFGGMAGLLIVEGAEDDPGSLESVPEVADAKDVPIVLQLPRSDQNGNVPFVNQYATMYSGLPDFAAQLRQQEATESPTGSAPPPGSGTGGSTGSAPVPGSGTGGGGRAGQVTTPRQPCPQCGVWSTYKDSFAFLTTNGAAAPKLEMKPGEVQRWRLLNAAPDIGMALVLTDESGKSVPMHLLSNDGLTVPKMITTTDPIVLGSGNRADVLVKAPSTPGTFQLQMIDGTGADLRRRAKTSLHTTTEGKGVPVTLNDKIGFDFQDNFTTSAVQDVSFPIDLGTVTVGGDSVSMGLPAKPLPIPAALPSRAEMEKSVVEERHVAFEICGNRGLSRPSYSNAANMGSPTQWLDSCGWFFQKYDEKFWGGTQFTNLLMMRNADDKGEVNPSPPPSGSLPRINYKGEGLFTAGTSMFDDMKAGTVERWTVENRSWADHPFHIHTNPFLVTHVNGVELKTPEWRDTMIIPAASPAAAGDDRLHINNECGKKPPPGNKGLPCVTYGSITFLTSLDPDYTGDTLTHCHELGHEDLGMMQQLTLTGDPSTVTADSARTLGSIIAIASAFDYGIPQESTNQLTKAESALGGGGASGLAAIASSVDAMIAADESGFGSASGVAIRWSPSLIPSRWSPA